MELAKLIRKPLKGYAQTGFLEFDSISVNNIVTSAGVNIVDQVEGDIINTNIGIGGPADGEFNNIVVNETTTLYGTFLAKTTSFDEDSTKIEWVNGILSLDGELDINLGVSETEQKRYLRINSLAISQEANGILLKNNEPNSNIIIDPGQALNVNGSFSVNGSTDFFSANVQTINLSANQTTSLTSIKNATLGSSTENVILNAGYTSGSTAAPTSGSIVMNAKTSVFVPKDIPMQFGSNCNYIKGETGGLIVGSCVDMFLNLPANRKIFIPDNVGMQFGSDFNTRIMYDNQTQSFNIYGNTINQVGNTTITGQLANYNVSQIKMVDPILTLGGLNPLASSDIMDRGLEYFYNKSGVPKMGWFGWKNNTNRFAFYEQSVNTNEIISGTIGNLEVNTIYNNNIIFQTQGNIDLNCGNLINTKVIKGCNGGLAIQSSTGNISIESNNNIALNAQKTIIPQSSQLVLNNEHTTLSAQTSGQLVLYAQDKIVLDSNVHITGDINAILSTIVNINDPIISIGGINGVQVDDNKDRGIEFYWYANDSEKRGFFGFKDDSQRFVFIPNGTNQNEVFTGDYGSIEVGNIYGNDIFADSINNLNSIELENGNITGVNTISGGSIEIKTTSGDILLTPHIGSDVVLPDNTTIIFGNQDNYIGSDSTNNLIISSGERLLLESNYGIFIKGNDNNTGENVIFIGNTETSIKMTDGDLAINTPNSIKIPENTEFQFTQDGSLNKIYSSDNTLYILGEDKIAIDTPTLNISGDTIVNGDFFASNIVSDNTPYIYPLGSYRLLDITQIRNSATTGKLLLTTNVAHYLKIGDLIKIRATNCVPSIDGTYSVSGIMNTTDLIINHPHVLASGNFGILRSSIVTDPAKDVGIQVNWHTGVTTGSVESKTGFFGFKRDTKRWTFYREGINNNDVFTGVLGDVELNKANVSKLSGFELDGGMTAGGQLISGSNFEIKGGKIDNTVIGETNPKNATFTNLTSTVSSTVNDQTVLGNLNYSLEYIDFTTSNTNANVGLGVIISFVSIQNANLVCELFIGDGQVDGQLKTIIASQISNNSTYILNFGSGNLITPFIPGGAISAPNFPSKVLFKRQGQSMSLIWNDREKYWVPIGGNGGKIL